MNVDQVVDHFGGKAEAARALDISYQAVQQWFDSGKVPEGRQYQIQILSNGALKVAAKTQEKVA